MKRILALIICLCMIMSVAPVTIFAIEGTLDYTGGTKLLDYTLDTDFSNSEAGKLTIKNSFAESDGFKVEYTDDGIAVVRTAEEGSNSTEIKNKFGLNYVYLADQDSYSRLYQRGFSGVYAIEFTLAPDMISSDDRRTNLSFSDALGGMHRSTNEIRLYTGKSNYHGKVQAYGKNPETNETSNATLFGTSTTRTQFSLRVVVDTVNKLYDVYVIEDNGDYTHKFTSIYDTSSSTTPVITSLVYNLRASLTKDAKLTFKNIKLYEIQRDETTAGNIAFEAFKANTTAPLVADPTAVVDDIVIPSTWSGYEITSSDETVLGADGKITRGDTDKTVTLTVAGNKAGVYFQKVYDLTIKAIDKVGADIAAMNMPATGSTITGDTISLLETGTVYGSELTWVSSHPEVISTKGEITRADTETEVTLTVTAELNGETANATYVYKVPAKEAVPPSGGDSGEGGGNDSSDPDDSTDPNEGGTVLGEYTLNSEFAATDLGKKVIRIITNSYFNTEATNDGIVVTRSDKADTTSNNVQSLALRLVNAIEDEDNKTVTYQTGFSGTYAFEFTFNSQLKGTNGADNRMDFYFTDNIDGSSSPTNNNIRLKTKGTLTKEGGNTNITFSKSVNGTDKTIRIVVDTKNKRMYGYDVEYVADASTGGITPKYTLRGSDIYAIKKYDAISSLLFTPRRYAESNSYITFKSFKVFEITRDSENATNIAFEAFKNSIPASFGKEPIVSDIDLSSIPADYTITSSDESVLKADGTIVRGNEDKDVTLTISGGLNSENYGVSFERVYSLTIKAANKASVDIDALQMPTNANLSADTIELPEYGSVNGSHFTWTSSHPEIIALNGTITKPETTTEVTLTVVAECDGETDSREFVYNVLSYADIEEGGSGGNVGGGDVGEVTDPSQYIGGTLLSDYDLNKDFSETPIGKYVISDKFTEADGFETTYTNEGVKITKLSEEGDSTSLNKFAINFTAPVVIDDEKQTELYQQGFAGIYAFELTFNSNLTASENRRTDMYFSDVLNGGAVSNNNLRIQTNGTLVQYHNVSGKSVSAFSYASWKANTDQTIRVVVDTNKMVMHGFDVDTSTTPYTYTYKGTSSYSTKYAPAISSLLFSPRKYLGQGAEITFKNVKVYEIERNETASCNIAMLSFKNALPDKIVDAPLNITENITLPSTLKDAGTVTTTDSGIITDAGVITRGFEDQKASIEVYSTAGGGAFRKFYNFVVKARDDLDVKNLADYNYKNAEDVKEFVYTGDNILAADGYKAVKTYGVSSQTIGLLKSKKSSDTYSDTYIYDHTGAYDYEVVVKPNLTSGKAYVELGNYNRVTGVFNSIAKFNITPSGIFYPAGTEDETIVGANTTGNEYTLKFRIDQGAKNYWLWVDSKLAKKLPFTYTTSKNIVNAYRISFDDTATDGDSLTIVRGNFTQQVYTEYTPVANAVAVADSMDVYDITSNPADAYGSINLPTAEGYDILWTADNSLVDIGEKKIYRTSSYANITLTATISSVANPEVKVVKDFHIGVEATSDPIKLLEGALAKITAESITNQNADNLVADITLPSITEEGYALSWESLNPTLIDNDGKINKTFNFAQDTQVSLKVTASFNGVELPKTINLTIAKRGADVTMDYSQIPESVSGVVAYKATVANQNGTVYLQDDIGNNIIGVKITDSKVSFDYKGTDNGTVAIGGTDFELKVLMNSDDRCASVFVNDELVLDYVPYITNVTNFKTSVAQGTSVSNEKVILDEYSLFDYNIQVFDYYDGLELPYVDSNLVLKTNAVGGVKVEWLPSAQSPVSTDGTYQKTSYIDFFDITLKLSMLNGTDAVYEDKMDFVAVPSEDNNVMKNATLSSDANENITHNKSKAVDEDYTTYYIATGVSETKNVTVDLGSVSDISALYFFQEINDGGMLSCDIYLSEDGAVWSDVPVASPVFTDLNSNLVAFGMHSARYVKLTNIVATAKTFKVRELKGYITYTSNDKAYIDIMAIGLPTDRTLTVSSLSLPSVGSVHGSTLVWQSTDTSVISLDGKITPPASKTEVALTVTATHDGKTAVKTYIYYFPGTGAQGGGGAGGGAGGDAGGGVSGPAGVNAGGTSISALPQSPEIVQIPSEDNIPKPPVESGIFGDVKTTDWFYSQMVALKDAGIVSGYDDGNFYPNKLVSREEFLKMLLVAANVELSETTEGFSDVNADDWFVPYVYTAKEKGIAGGVTHTEFGIGMAIRRQDMAVMIFNALGIEFDAEDITDTFTDDNKIAKYAYNAVYAMKANGFINGYETGDFNPAGQLTRAEATKVIYMVMEHLK